MDRTSDSRLAGADWSGLPLRSWFLLFGVGGGIAIYVGERWFGSAWVTVGGPLLAMASYVAIGYRVARDRGTISQFADSAYYLGFLLTVFSLTVTVMELNDRTEIWSVVNRFGAKLTTTLVGLAVRIYLVNFRDSFDDAIESTEETLARSAQNLRERFEQLSVDLTALSDGLVLGLRRASERATTELDQTITASATALTASIEQVRGAATVGVGELHQALGVGASEVSESLKAGARSLGSSASSASTRISKAAESMSARLDGVTMPPDVFVNILREPISRLSAALERQAKEIERATDAMAPGATRFEDAARSLAGFSTAVEALQGSLTSAGAYAVALEGLGRSAEGVRSSFSGLPTVLEQGTAEVRKALESVRVGCGQLGDAVGEAGRNTSSLAAELDAAKEALRGLRADIQSEREARRSFWSRFISPGRGE